MNPRTRLLRVALLAVVATALACSGDTAPSDAGRTDATTDLGDSTLACATDQMRCGSVCVDLRTSRDHCGACGHPCEGSQLCVGGACQLGCPGAQQACAGQCINPQTDNLNCGACGNACPAGQVCSNGACATSGDARLAT